MSTLVKIRSRLHEHFWRNVREDCISKFSMVPYIRDIRISTYLPVKHLVADPELVKYRTCSYMELITNCIPRVRAANYYVEDPDAPAVSGMEHAQTMKLKGLLLQGKAARKNKSGVEHAINRNKDLNSEEIYCEMTEADKIFNFLEKLREFYIQDDDYSNADSITDDNIHLYYYKIGKFAEKYLSIAKGENPNLACPMYSINARDFLKPTDLEYYMESFTDIMVYDKEKLRFLIKPTIELLKADSGVNVSNLNNLKIMDYVTSQFFSPYMRRVKVANEIEENNIDRESWEYAVAFSEKQDQLIRDGQLSPMAKRRNRNSKN